MNLSELKERFRKYQKRDIVITRHAELQALVREIDLEEVKENIINPVILVYIRQQKAEKYN